ncbi:MAG TPA: thiamine phosphate synthase [Candidatus Dormibacteraeota bacterium]|nr:thiamine phosphate synthase [Candidatus Dormibacteraeota bacterium]
MAVVTSASAGLRAAPKATVIQLRAPDLSTAALEREARKLVASASVPVVISSRCDVALASGAAGVNLPERDVSVADARKLLGELLVGRSVHSIEGALRAEAEDADFVIFGPVWESASHPDLKPAGLSALEAVARATGIPVLAIGGVTAERVDRCLAAGAGGYAAIGLFTSPPRGEGPGEAWGGEPGVTLP